MSDRTKNAFYMWYLTCKNNPWKLTQLCPNSGVKRMVSEKARSHPSEKRALHIQSSPPSIDECNKAVERAVRVSDRPLAERERVTLPVVNNWFNNRRKEAKKQLRQQHAAAMAAVSVGMSSLSQQSLGLPSVASMPSLNWHQSVEACPALWEGVNLHPSTPMLSLISAARPWIVTAPGILMAMETLFPSRTTTSPLTSSKRCDNLSCSPWEVEKIGILDLSTS
ncbi:hypothetical protein CEXT_223782 [Caerostris extrusa]|nr:hypothetical protein CEXT_223782 [Caerostris extrusa]